MRKGKKVHYIRMKVDQPVLMNEAVTQVKTRLGGLPEFQLPPFKASRAASFKVTNLVRETGARR